MLIAQRNILILISLHFSIFVLAQKQNESYGIHEEIPFTIFKTQVNVHTIDDILGFHNEFKVPSNFTEKTYPDDVYWIKLDFGNHLDVVKLDTILYIKLNTFDHGDVFYTDNHIIVNKHSGDKRKPYSNY